MRKPFLLLVTASLAALAPLAPARAEEQAKAGHHPHLGGGATEQDRAFRATQNGRSMPLPMIERMVRRHVGSADYLGPELRGGRYRLKYMVDGRVLWVDVDAATGRILDTSDD